MISISRKMQLIKTAVNATTAIFEGLLSGGDQFYRLVFYTQQLMEEERKYLEKQIKSLMMDYVKYVNIVVNIDKIEASLCKVPTSFLKLPPVDEDEGTEVYLFERE